jgi:hypothetical protein
MSVGFSDHDFPPCSGLNDSECSERGESSPFSLDDGDDNLGVFLFCLGIWEDATTMFEMVDGG